jgi:hypothetical protein
MSTSNHNKPKGKQINVYFTFPATSSLADAYMVIPCYSPDYAEWKMSTLYPKSFYTKWNAIEFMVELENNKKLYPIPFGYMPEDIVKDN